jgi:hypothetical protein
MTHEGFSRYVAEHTPKESKATRVKRYVKDHALELITATSAVILVIIAVKDRRDLHLIQKNDAEEKSILRDNIKVLTDMGADFTFYPGVGLLIDPRSIELAQNETLTYENTGENVAPDNVLSFDSAENAPQDAA